MKFTFFCILFFSFFLICFSNTNQKHLARADGCNLDTDSTVNILLDEFIHSFNNKDSIFIQNNLISQSEYDSIIYYLKGYKVSCLTQPEEYYKVNSIYYEYNNYIINNKKIDSIAFVDDTSSFGCGGVNYTKINAKVFFNLKNGVFESPLAFIFIKDVNSKYRLLTLLFFAKTINYE